MTPWLLAFDLDGTACDSNGRLGAESRRALLSIREKGHLVCFATGRRDVDMRSMPAEDQRCADYLLLNNGGKLVRTADGRVLFNELVDPDTAKSLISACLAHDLQLHVLSGTYWGINRWNEGLRSYTELLGVEPKLYSALEQTPYDCVEGFMATADKDAVCRLIDAHAFPLYYTDSEDTCVDIMRMGLSKWNGLTRLAGLLGIPNERILAAGDYSNDIEMIKNARIGVAVQNALPSVKEAADHVTARDCAHDAVAEVIQHFDNLLNRGRTDS